MHPITATAAAPDAIVAMPGQDLLHGVPLALAGSGVSGAPMARPGGGAGPLRNGNPRGNPNLAPPPGQAPGGKAYRGQALHGGKSTGPRTPDGLASVARVHTTHGEYAEAGPSAVRRPTVARMRIIKRLMTSQDRAVRRAKPGRGPLHGLPPGVGPSGGTVRPGGAACEGSDTNSMNSGAGGGTAEARADAPAAAQAPERGAACEISDTNPMNSGAGGGTPGGVPRHLPRSRPPSAGRPATIPTRTP
jgi:hypothetical protein